MNPPAPPILRPVTPWATRITLGVVAVVSLLALALPPTSLLDLLAKDNAAISAGQWWRLVTPGLVHGSLIHLAMNGVFLLDLGTFVERFFGAARMEAILWGSVVTGSVASYLWTPAPSVGISGGLFGLVGAMLAQGVRYWRRLSPEGRRVFLRGPIEIIVLNAVLGMSLRFIDNSAHLGGLFGGLALGALLGLPRDVRAALHGGKRPHAPEPSIDTERLRS